MHKHPSSSLELKINDQICVTEYYNFPNRPNRKSTGVIIKVFIERIDGINYLGYQAKYDKPPSESPIVLLNNHRVPYYTLIKIE